MFPPPEDFKMIDPQELAQIPGPQTLLQGLLRWVRPAAAPEGSSDVQSLAAGGVANLDDPLEMISAVATGADPKLFDAQGWMQKVIEHDRERVRFFDGVARPVLLSKDSDSYPLPPALQAYWKTAANLPFKSLDPKDYVSGDEYLKTLTPSPTDFATASSMPLGPMIDEAVSNFGSKHPAQLLHLLNLAYVRAALKFQATALGDLHLNRTPASQTPNGKGGIDEVDEAFSADFILEGRPELTQSINLSGSHLFSLSRWIDQTLASRWSEALDAELKSVIGEFFDQWSLSLEGVDIQLARQALDDKFRNHLRDQANKHPGFQRLIRGVKAHVNLQGYNKAMKEFNAGLDRTALSLALRFGPKNSLTSASYEFFSRADVRDVLAASTSMGAFAPLQLPDELLTAVCSIPRACVAPYKLFLKKLESACAPELLEQLQMLSPGYFLRFPARQPPSLALSFGSVIAEPLTHSLDGLLQINYADPSEAAEIASSAMSRILKELGPKALPPGEFLISHSAALGFLSKCVRKENFMRDVEYVDHELTTEERIHGLTMAMGELAARRKRPGGTIESAMESLVNVDQTDYTEAPSLDALIDFRAPATKRFARSHGLAFRSSLGLATSVSTESEVSTPGVPNSMKWDLSIVRITDGQNLVDFIDGSQTFGTGYNLSFKAQGATERWIHFSVCTTHTNFWEAAKVIPSLGLGALAPTALHVFNPCSEDGRTLVLCGTGDEGRRPPIAKHPFRGVLSKAAYKKSTGANLFVELDYLAFNTTAITNPVPSASTPQMSDGTQKALSGHLAKLMDLVQSKIAGLQQTDPMMFAALFSAPKASFVNQPDFIKSAPKRIGVQKGMRLAMVASEGDPRIIEEVGARISNPFALTSARASLLDVCEHAQVSQKTVNGKTNLQAVIQGLARNPACLADPESFRALLERSMVKCLEKEPGLLKVFINHGVKPTDKVLSLIQDIHPRRLTEEAKTHWQAAQMTAEIDRIISAGHGAAPAPGDRGQQVDASIKPKNVQRRRVGI